MFGTAGCRNLLLDGCNRVTFDNVTVSTVGGTTLPMLTGIEVRDTVRQCVFVNPNIEDCTRAYDIGTGVTAANSVSGNLFINALEDCPFVTPDTTTIGSVTATMGFVVRADAGTNWGGVLGMRQGADGYTYGYYDAALGITSQTGGTLAR